MRGLRAAALAAALAGAALAAGCKPSSVTPFGIGRVEPRTDTGAGLYQGVGTTGGKVEFSVANGEVIGLSLEHLTPGCTRRMTSGDANAPIENDSFSLEVLFDPAGRLVFSGTFPSAETASGSYFFEGLAGTASCEPSGSGSFVASRRQ